jgi:hypothetical protein
MVTQDDIDKAVLKEREECAYLCEKIIEGFGIDSLTSVAKQCLYAIRNRK